ncbi:MAG: hypothetical protein M0006_05550 [Magnetospirillum sp.]|nr:hypothetical protein [Magnetospirillum sp.]
MSVYGALLNGITAFSGESLVIDDGRNSPARIFPPVGRTEAPDIGREIITLVALQSAHSAAASVAATADAMIRTLLRPLA